MSDHDFKLAAKAARKLDINSDEYNAMLRSIEQLTKDCEKLRTELAITKAECKRQGDALEAIQRNIEKAWSFTQEQALYKFQMIDRTITNILKPGPD